LKPVRRASPTAAVVVAYVTGAFMAAMDLHIVNVALPTLGRTFHASIAHVQWTIVGYALSLAVFIPASGWIGDRFGTKRTFLVALATFTLASALCGTAQDLGELIVARVVQGIGGGMLLPTGTAMLFRAYAPEERARITRLLILPIILAPASAPIIGGVFTQDVSWRWVFLVNVPIGLAVFAFCAVNLEEYREHARGRFDLTGFVLGGGGLALALYAISEGSVRGWGSAPILAAGAAGVVTLALFARLEYRRPEPILNLRLLDDRLFRATNIVSMLTSGALLGTLYLTPIFLQEVQGYTPIGSGTTTFLEALGVIVASQSVGRLYPRLGPRTMAAGGALVMCALLLGFQLVDAGTSPWLLRAEMFLIGAANTACYLAVQASMFTGISHADTGHASAIYNTGRQASVAISVAILSAVVASVAGPRLVAFHAAYLGAAAISALGAATAITLIRTSDAAPSMVGRAARVSPRDRADADR
jgi:EmrB/QacA subfamily drug resistance transporter